MARPRLGDFGLVTVASVVAGVIGYVLTSVAAARLGPEGYPLFAVFWSVLYLVVGSLGGMQQETARATRPAATPAGRAVLARAAPVSVAVTAVLLGATAVLWAPPVFAHADRSEAPAVVVGAAGYVAVAVVTGAMYGIGRIRVVVAIVLTDAVVRLAAVLAVLILAPESGLLPWAIALPFPISLAVGLPALIRAVRGGAGVDVGGRRFAAHGIGAVLGAVSTSVIMSGFPAILSAIAPHGGAQLGTLLLLVTLVRAPLMVGALALQSFVVVRLRDLGTHAAAWALRVAGVVVLVGAVLAGLAALAGPPLLPLVLGSRYEAPAGLLAALVGCSALVALNILVGALLLARADHAAYTAGWIVVAVVSIGLLALPLDLVPRALVALAAGPIAGLAVQLVAARRDGLRSRRTAS